jgi:hypothetical protein
LRRGLFAGATLTTRLPQCAPHGLALMLGSKTNQVMEATMGGGILLWLLGVPIPIIIILVLLFH